MSGKDANGLSGANAMGDTLEFVKNLWGSMKLPGMSMPSLSTEDIDKQITDLKAVESWLQMNMSMLRSSIQALEVQSATLKALRSVGQTFANAAGAATAASTASASSAFDKPASDKTASDRPAFDSPFSSAFNSPFDKVAKPDEAPPSAAAAAAAFPDAAAMAAQFGNPAAWWNTVQEQFSNAVGQALTPPKKKASRRTGTARKTTTSKSSKSTSTSSSNSSGTRKRTPKA